MKKLESIIILIIALTIFTSCNTKKKVSNTENPEPDICESMTFTSQPDKLTTDYYTIDTLFIVKDCLNIWVSYEGGCGDAYFTLYYSDEIMESLPPQTNLKLKLTDKDHCRAIVQQKLYYNLSFFKEFAENNGVVLHLSGTEKSIIY